MNIFASEMREAGTLEMLILNVSLPIRGKDWGYLDRALTRVLTSNKLRALGQVLCLSLGENRRASVAVELGKVQESHWKGD